MGRGRDFHREGSAPQKEGGPPRRDVVDYPYAGGLGVSLPRAPGYRKSILGDIYRWTGYEFLSRVGNASVPASEMRLWRCLLMVK